MHRKIEIVVRVVRLDEESSLIDLLQISGIVGRKEWLTLKTVGYRKLLMRWKGWVNGGNWHHCFLFLLLIGEVILTRVMVHCAVMLKILCLGIRVPPDCRHHSHVKGLQLLRMVEMIVIVLRGWGGLGRDDRQVQALTRKR